MNCVDAAGVWLQLRQSLDAEPSSINCFHTLSAWTPGADATFANVALPPLLQKNGSHCQVVSSAGSHVNAIPWWSDVVRALAAVTSCAHVFGGLTWAALSIAM